MDKPWLNKYDEGVPVSIEYPQITLGQMLSDISSKHPKQIATIFGAVVGSRILDAKLTYKELNDEVDRFAAGLQQQGVKQGDRVAIMLPNSPQFIIAAYAVWRIGGIVVCCNPLYVGREIEHLLSDSGSETIVVMSAFYERVKEIRANTKLKRVIVTNIKEYFPGLLKLLFTVARERKEGHRVDISGDADTVWFQEVLGTTSTKPEPATTMSEDIATLIYTGGTTGVPKGVQLTHFNLVSNAIALNIMGRTRGTEEVIVAVMPYFHSYGMTASMNTAIASGMSIILIPNPRDMAQVLISIEKYGATYYPGVPTMFVGFNNYPGREKFDLSSLRAAFSAAAPLPPEVQQEFESITGGRLLEAYGLTETSPAASIDPMDNPRHDSIGIPLPDTELRIMDVETGNEEMPVGETGEIIIKGPQVMKGYWKMPTETANALRKGPDGQPGWFFTGDIGYMDEDGFFHISDRKKDMIIAGGYNIYPAEVEAVLFEHPDIQEAAVIGVPDEKRGETVKAFVILKSGRQTSAEEITTFCREQLAAYKVPRQIEFRDELPKSIVGKVLRRELREEEASTS